MNRGGSGSRSPNGCVLEAQKDAVCANGWGRDHFPVCVEIPHVICWFVKVGRVVTINIGGAIGTKMSRLLCPRSKCMSLMVSNVLDPSVTKGFPDFPDLIGAGSYLNWRILAFVEPWGPSTFVHVGEDA